MAQQRAVIDAEASHAQPIINTIGAADLRDALTRGLADFKAMPTHLIFLCLIYPIVILMIVRIDAGYDVLPLIFPLLAGYTLIGPLGASGMYELSRRREQGLDISRAHAFDVLRFPSIRSIAILGTMLMALYFAWLLAARAIYWETFGGVVPESIAEFVHQVLTTPAGWTLMAVGGGIGFVFAVVVFTLSVVSFPMLLDREVDVTTAVQTSIRAVAANPVIMALWGIIVITILFLGSLPFFVGLAVALPWLGHASWHLYRKVVAR